METFAYLHAAQEYEYPEQKEINLNWANPAALTLMGIVCSTGVVNFTSAVQAATIWRGDAGANVVRLQELLRNAGYFPAPTTGFFGDFTETAVQDFQHAKGLEVDGIAGFHTFQALENVTAPIVPIAPPVPPIIKPIVPIAPPIPPIITPIAPGPGGVGSTALGFGDSGSSVTQVQDLLRRAGYFPGPSTGYFGAATRNSVERFQAANRLPVDGFVGRATFIALENAPAA